jgi:hypothetical protein
MFVIRNAQWDRLAEQALADFIVRMRAHLREFFPEQCDALGEAKIGQLIDYGIRRAREWGFESERDVCTYIDLMCVFGNAFDRDKRLPWARHILETRFPPDPGDRIELLHETALELLREINAVERGVIGV